MDAIHGISCPREPAHGDGEMKPHKCPVCNGTGEVLISIEKEPKKWILAGTSIELFKSCLIPSPEAWEFEQADMYEVPRTTG